MKKPAVYIMCNEENGTLYTGVTSDLVKRIYQHKTEEIKGFTSKYKCKILVYYELFGTMESASLRDKQIKSGSRSKKLKLINDMNPNWIDLYNQII